MKYILTVLLFCINLSICFAQTIVDLENEIRVYESAIELYQQKIDSLNSLIARIDYEDKRELISQGISFVAEYAIEFYNSPNLSFAKRFYNIPKGDSVTIVKMTEQNTFEALHKNKVGYISARSASRSLSDDMLNALNLQHEMDLRLSIFREAEEQAMKDSISQVERKRIEQANAIKAAQEKKEREKAVQDRRTRIIKIYGEATGKRILDGKIWLGMTDKMARDSWGSPYDINRSVGSYGVHEQWVYRKYDANLYFENGVLTSWQD